MLDSPIKLRFMKDLLGIVYVAPDCSPTSRSMLMERIFFQLILRGAKGWNAKAARRRARSSSAAGEAGRKGLQRKRQLQLLVNMCYVPP